LAATAEQRAAALGLNLVGLAERMGRTPGLVTHLVRAYAIAEWRFVALCAALETTPELWGMWEKPPSRQQLVRLWRRNIRRSKK
jgi:plasmid maintenance system antidote protein VapI